MHKKALYFYKAFKLLMSLFFDKPRIGSALIRIDFDKVISGFQSRNINGFGLLKIGIDQNQLLN